MQIGEMRTTRVLPTPVRCRSTFTQTRMSPRAPRLDPYGTTGHCGSGHLAPPRDRTCGWFD